MSKLLTRDNFRDSVIERDKNCCVLCKNDNNLCAHHIIERRLFSSQLEFSGYFIDNGATVCEECHFKCERTDTSVEEVRLAAGITKIILPEHFYRDQIYDKWGNIILANGTRLRGELFYDESIQKILADHLHSFTHLVKAPRTWHLPWSPGMHDDDRMLKDMSVFNGKRIIVSSKLDGENSSLYSDHIHARSLDSGHHNSRAWVKQFWSTFAHDIPDAWRIVGENVYAEHAIHYDNLKSYFYGFQIWNDKNICLSWDDTVDWFKLLNIIPVIVLYDDVYNEKAIRQLEKTMDFNKEEGYVMRIADEFSYREYKTKVGKYVRKNHILSSKHHWASQQVIKNELAEEI